MINLILLKIKHHRLGNSKNKYLKKLTDLLLLKTDTEYLDYNYRINYHGVNVHMTSKYFQLSYEGKVMWS